MPPRVLKELAEIILEPLTIIFENSYRSGKVPDDYKRINIVPVFKKVKMKQMQNSQSDLSTTKIMEPVIKEFISKHIEVHKEFRNSQHGCIKSKSGQSNLIPFCNKVTDSVFGESYRHNII